VGGKIDNLLEEITNRRTVSVRLLTWFWDRVIEMFSRESTFICHSLFFEPFMILVMSVSCLRPLYITALFSAILTSDNDE
jgi:hypothetical protein